MGTNASAGEVRMLFVGSGVWKMSRLLPVDMALGTDVQRADNVGCLITEVVVPGFHWEDHAFLTRGGLNDLFKDVEGGAELIERFKPHLTKSEQQV